MSLRNIGGKEKLRTLSTDPLDTIFQVTIIGKKFTEDDWGKGRSDCPLRYVSPVSMFYSILGRDSSQQKKRN